MQSNIKIDELESKQPMKIGDYLLAARMCNDEPMNMSTNNIGFNYKQYPTNQFHVQLESKLRGMDEKLSKYPTYKSLEEQTVSTEVLKRPSPTDFITNIGEPTRMSKSCYDPTIDISDRLEPLPINIYGTPQENPLFKEDIRGGYNSRMV